MGIAISIPLSDKIGHVGLFGILGATLAYGRVRAAAPPPHVVLILSGVLYGLADEWHQSFVPGRTATAGDLLADVVGVALGYGVVVLWHRRSAAAAGPATTAGPAATAGPTATAGKEGQS